MDTAYLTPRPPSPRARTRAALGLTALSVVACGKQSTQKSVPEANAATTGNAVGSSLPASEGGPRLLLPGATCHFPQRTDVDATIAAGCIVDVTRSVVVEKGSTLTIERGVTLRFHPGTFLEVGQRGSRLVAQGTKERPIVFTSAPPKTGPGSWVGVVFDDDVGEKGALLDYAVIENAGAATHGGRGALTVFSAFKPGRVSVKNTIFRHNGLAAVSNGFAEATFGAFEGNTFEDNARSLSVAPAVFTAIGGGRGGNVLGGVVDVLGGLVNRSGTWPKVASGIRVVGPISVEGEREPVTPAILTIEPGSVVRFSRNTWLEVGTRAPAGLVAREVTFTSAEEKPAPGDWVGLMFGDHAQGTRVVGGTIEYAGAEEHSGDAAVTFVGKKSWQVLDVTFSGETFRRIKQAHFSTNGEGCNKALDPRNGIVWDIGVELCK